MLEIDRDSVEARQSDDLNYGRICDIRVGIESDAALIKAHPYSVLAHETLIPLRRAARLIGRQAGLCRVSLSSFRAPRFHTAPRPARESRGHRAPSWELGT